jgi:hypothetical protein
MSGVCHCIHPHFCFQKSDVLAFGMSVVDVHGVRGGDSFSLQSDVED